MGGNDIALIKKHPKETPPTDNQIIRAMIITANQIHDQNIIPIIVPILPRENTKYEITKVTPEEYKTRAHKINRTVEKELSDELGYNPMPFNYKEKRNLEDKIHLTQEEYYKITKDIVKKIEEIRKIRNLQQRKTREREDKQEEEKQENSRHKERQRWRNREMISENERKTRIEMDRLQNKARNWRLRIEKQEKIDENLKQLEEENKHRNKEETTENKNKKVLKLASTMKSILIPSEETATQTDAITSRNIHTQTPSIIEILPQLLEDLKICVTKRAKEDLQK